MDKKLELAYRYQENGEYEKAIECFTELGKIDIYKEISLFEIGKSYKMMNKPQAAIERFCELLNNNSSYDEALKELGQTSRLSGCLEPAITFLEGIKKKNSRACMELARLYLELNSLDSALENIKEFKKQNPDDIEVDIELGKIYRKREEFDTAVSVLEGIFKSLPENRDVMYELGNTYFDTGDIERSAVYFEKLVALYNNDRQAYIRLVEIYTLLNDIEQSEKAAKRVLGLTPAEPFDQDITLNELEIIQRKIELKSKVKRLWVTVTSRCNIRCKTCGLWKQKWDLPHKTALEIMELYPYLERIVWLGGEVFLYKHFEEMFDRASDFSNMKQQVITNGVILTEKWIEKIVNTPNAELTFSVDGSTKEVYESIRNGANYEKLLEKIRMTMALKKKFNSRIDIRLNALVMKSNYHQLEDIMDFAKKEGFNQITYLAVHFENAPDENIFEENRDSHIMKVLGDTIPGLWDKAEKYGLELDILLPPGEMDFKEAITEKEKQEEMSAPHTVRSVRNEIYCKMPWKYMMICDDGNVIMTGSCIKSVGNINETSLGDIWNSGMSRFYRKSMIDNNFEGLCRDECFFRMELNC